MKSLKYLIILAVGILTGTTSCNDDFLERQPPSKINDGMFWKTTNDLELYLNNLYSKNGLLPHYNSSYYDRIGPYTDDSIDGSDTQARVDYNKRMNSEYQLASATGWSTTDWELLRNINYFMAYYTNVQEDFEKVAPYVGEALVFRSLFYFIKLKRYGNLPWAPDLLGPESEELFDGRLPRNEVVDNMMADLDLAVEYLPASKGKWTGRITKETALALQARIALFEGTWEKYHKLKNTPFQVEGQDGRHFIEKAAKAAGELMKLAAENSYPALDNVGKENGYWELFNQKDYSSSKEVIFWRKYSVDADQLFNRWINISYTGAGTGITKRLVEQYLCTDGKPIHTGGTKESPVANPLYQGDATLTDVVANRDPRLNQTICVPDEKHYRWKPDTYFETPTITAELDTRCVTGYQMYKGHSADKTEYDARKGTNGCIYFRYAETLLIYAEARAELGLITQDDINKTINLLRGRVGMPGLVMNSITADPMWLFATTGPAAISPLLQEIRRERTVELACEGLRVDDIFRWAAADELIVDYRPKGAVLEQWKNTTLNLDKEWIFEDDEGYMDPYAQWTPMRRGYRFKVTRDYLYPIPESELNLNPALRPQNPGW